MGRMHAPGKGISGSAIPYRRAPHSWCKITPKEVSDLVCRFARKGYKPAGIGVLLRDMHGVGLVKSVTNTKILRILRANGLAPSIPEDLYHMIKKAVSIRKHLEKFRKDKDAKFRLILIESRIYRLARYYRQKKKLPYTWRYQSANAAALISKE
mmetsp:Transcript_17122/g.42052  ORF Transcript_17122/g.42052 Transcript_17122/m.42052 type:complete len:154 (+) Transcript_17122:37-498(+)